MRDWETISTTEVTEEAREKHGTIRATHMWLKRFFSPVLFLASCSLFLASHFLFLVVTAPCSSVTSVTSVVKKTYLLRGKRWETFSTTEYTEKAREEHGTT